MKHFFVAGLVAMAAAATQASYLYWQIDGSDNSAVAHAVDSYNTKWKLSGDKAVSMNDVTAARLMRLDKLTGQAVAIDAILKEDFQPGALTNPNEISVPYLSGDNYSYYIEIISNSAEPYSLLAVSEQMSYDQLVAAGAVYEDSELNVPSIVAWSGGSFSAAPEPTSGLLLMIGLGLLGLKRKHA